MPKKFVLYPITLFSLIFIISLHSCDSSQNSLTTKQIIEEAQVSDPIIKVDTMFKDFKGYDHFTDEILFGMPLKKWNAFVARKTKEGYYDKLFETGYNSYDAHATIKGAGKVSFWLKPHFLENFISEGNTAQVIRIDKQVQFEPVLKELNYEIDVDFADDGNDLVKGFIRDHNMQFVSGLEPMHLSDDPGTIKDYKFNNDIMKKFKKDEIANKAEWESIKYSTESLFENKICYAVMKIENRKNNELLRNAEGDIVSVGDGYTRSSIYIHVVSKFYSELDIEKYLTQQQKDSIQSKHTTEELMNKALKN